LLSRAAFKQNPPSSQHPRPYEAGRATNAESKPKPNSNAKSKPNPEAKSKLNQV
jgi:hypothetical protein